MMSFKFVLPIASIIIISGWSTEQASAQVTEIPPPPDIYSVEGTAPQQPEGVTATPESLAAKLKKNKTKKDLPGDLNSESSSFVPDPDPLDPLPPNAENLKDEDDIIVDDIKDVLNKPLPPPVLEEPKAVDLPLNPSASAAELHPSKIVDSSDDGEEAPIIKKPRKKTKKAIGRSAKIKTKTYNNNEPDLELEKRFHQLYQRINSVPTSEQTWEAVAGPRAAQVYVIQKGDNLYNISGTLFGDSQFWPKIWSLNEMDILNPHFIQPNRPIYFYPGTVDMPPTLGLVKTPNTIIPEVNDSVPILSTAAEKTTEVEKTPEIENAAPPREGELIEQNPNEDAIDRSRRTVLSDEKAIDGRTYDRQNTEWNNKRLLVRSLKTADEETLKIPVSFPEYFSGKYFEPPKADFSFDLKRPEIRPLEIPPNPYIITSSIIASDFIIPSAHADSIQCKENHFVSTVTKINPQAQPGRYFILEKLKLTSSTFKTTQIYRWIATADIAGDSLRILKCRQLINTDALIVSQEKINQLQDPTEVAAKDFEIIEGLDYVNQIFVGANQFVLLSSSSDLILPEQSYSIYSKQAGANVGKITIVKKKGQLAIGYVTEASDVIHINDNIVVE
jgi:hypothetical protein